MTKQGWARVTDYLAITIAWGIYILTLQYDSLHSFSTSP